MERVTVPAEDGLATGVKADNTGKQTVEESGLGRPEWLPPEFKTVEAYVESNKELRATFTRTSQELAELKKDQTGTSEPGESEGEAEGSEGEKVDTPKIETAEDKAKAAADGETVLPGVTNEFAKEISSHAWEHGTLTDDHYAKLAEAGYSKQVVDDYMQGQIARASGANEALVNAGGGAENVNKMFDWAATKLSAEEQESYNAKFASGGADARMAMEHLKHRFESSGDAPGGSRVTGGNASSTETSVFRSTAQVTEAMSDPRYKTDPAYRAEVVAKLSRSNVL